MSSRQLESQSGRYGSMKVRGQSARHSIKASRKSPSSVLVVMPAKKTDIGLLPKGSLDGAFITRFLGHVCDILSCTLGCLFEMNDGQLGKALCDSHNF